MGNCTSLCPNKDPGSSDGSAFWDRLRRLSHKKNKIQFLSDDEQPERGIRIEDITNEPEEPPSLAPPPAVRVISIPAVSEPSSDECESPAIEVVEAPKEEPEMIVPVEMPEEEEPPPHEEEIPMADEPPEIPIADEPPEEPPAEIEIEKPEEPAPSRPEPPVDQETVET